MLLEQFTRKALRVPFVEGGRTYDGWDCWGLVRCAQQDVFGIELPSYADEYGSTNRRDELRTVVDAHKADHWQRFDTAQKGDIAIVEMMGRPCHVGLMLDGKHMIHCEQKRGTCVERIDRAPWRGDGYDKVEGFYRYVK